MSDYVIKKKICGLIDRPPVRKRCFRNLKDVGSILVFYEARDSKEVEPCIETLRMMHKKVKICLYAPKELQPGANDDYFFVSAENDINIWGVPSDEICRQVKKLPADLLIDLSGRACYPMQYLLLQHPCPFKVGMKRSDLDLYDLSILVTDRDDIKYLFGQILFYLQTIHSK